MLKAGFDVLMVFVNWLKYPIYLIIGVVAVFYLLVGINIFVGLIVGKRFKKGTYRRYRKHSVLRRLLIDLPYQFTLDMFAREPDFFKYQGLIIFEGRQGSGKTSSMIEFARRMQYEYPKAKCLTNLNYLKQDDELNHWTQLVDYKNGYYGVIAVMDELQNWFSSNQSKDFPPAMLQTITQNRKNRRIILGTAQNFYLLAKPIRSQCTEVRRCVTLLGCLTIVRRFEPILDSEGNVAEFKKRGIYFYVHDQDLRDSYDTYHVIESLSKSGFQAQQIVPDVVTNNNILISKGK